MGDISNLPPVFTLEEVAEHLHLTPRAVLKIAKPRGLFLRFNRAYRFEEADIDAIKLAMRENVARAVWRPAFTAKTHPTESALLKRLRTAGRRQRDADYERLRRKQLAVAEEYERRRDAVAAAPTPPQPAPMVVTDSKPIKPVEATPKVEPLPTKEPLGPPWTLQKKLELKRQRQQRLRQIAESDVSKRCPSAAPLGGQGRSRILG